MGAAAVIRVDRATLEPLAVGSSELGALLGCDPWTTPLQLYRRKRGLEPPRPDNGPMRVGRLLEPQVVQLARERIPLRVRRNRVTWAHRTVPLFATPDAFVGPDRLLEVKVVGLRGRDGWDDGIPCRVSLQVQGQLLVTGRAAGYVAALVGTELELVTVERDEGVQASIVDAVAAFVDDHLTPGVPPDPLSWDERWYDLLAQLEGRDPLEVEALAGSELQAAGDRILELRALEARQADELETLRGELLAGLAASGGTKLTGSGWSAGLERRTGRVDWSGVALALYYELERVDPDPMTLARRYLELVESWRGEALATFVVRARKVVP